MPAPPKPGIAEHEESSLRIQKGAGLLGGWVLYMKTECRQGKTKAVDSTGVLVPRCWWHRFLRFFLIIFVSGLGLLGRCFWGVEKKRKEKSAGKASSQTSGG